MTPQAKQRIQLVLAVAIAVAAIRAGYILYQRHEDNVALQKRKQAQNAGYSNPDYYITTKKLYPYDLKSAKQLTNQPVWERWAAVAASLILAAVVIAFSSYGTEFRRFVELARVELRKIVWPSRHETGMTTVVVFVFVIAAGLFFWAVDWVLALATKFLTGQGG